MTMLMVAALIGMLMGIMGLFLALYFPPSH